MSFVAFKKLVDSKLKFGVYMLAKLPSAWFCGVRVQSLNEDQAEVSVPYKWLSQNPFKSIYFACQAMAAELSTGLLAMGHSYQSYPSVSMLITAMDAVYIKKASERIFFTCHDGLAIKEAIQNATDSGEAIIILATSIGRNAAGEEVSRFQIEWSFKVRSS